MGIIHAEIELINGIDFGQAKKHLIGEEEIRRIKVRMLIDTGAYMLAINENIQEYLQLPIVERKRMELADGRVITCDVVAPVEVQFHNRRTNCSAYVLPGDSEPLMGSIPMEELDVMIHPKGQELIVNPDYPDGPVFKFPSIRPVRQPS